MLMLHVGNEGDKIKGQNVETNTDGESQDGKGKKWPSMSRNIRLSLRLTPQEFVFKLI